MKSVQWYGGPEDGKTFEVDDHTSYVNIPLQKEVRWADNLGGVPPIVSPVFEVKALLIEEWYCGDKGTKFVVRFPKGFS